MLISPKITPMKTYFFTVLVTLTLLGGTSSCKKGVGSPAVPMTYSFQLLNERAEESMVFFPGQEIVFRFQIANSSDQVMYLNNPVFDVKPFLEVYDITGSKYQSIGKPYTSLCLSYVNYYIIPARSILTFAIPWVESPQYPNKEPFCSHAANTPLPKGRYRTSFAPLLTWHLGTEPETTATPDPAAFVREFEVR